MTAPAGLTRFSSRMDRLDRVFLRDRLKGAQSYDRIAGYFRSSIFELIHEEIPTIGRVRIVCNADLDPQDIKAAEIADAARDRAIMGSWHRQGDLSRVAIEQPRWAHLHEVLTRGNVEVRVVSRNNAPFLHGKAGVITTADGSTSSFVGSVNETANGWKHSYEIIWEDRSPESAEWVQDEFEWLWGESVPLPQAVIDEIGRVARRIEVGIHDLATDPLALMKASLVESPLRMSGESLQPWQKAFVRIWSEHREKYGAARILLADEVGVGKTLSMAATGALSVMLGDGPFLILCPATLTGQWQAEMLLKLGIPSCRWAGSRGWIAPGEQWTGQTDILRCPMQVGIVSTGILTTRNGSGPLPDAKKLLTGEFGMIALDEGHKARVQRDLSGDEEKGNLYQAMEILAQRCRHMVIGTATPIQTDTKEIWDLLKILARGHDHVLGTSGSRWNNAVSSLDLIRSTEGLKDEDHVWDLVRNPFPHKSEHQIFADLRQDFKVKPDKWITDRSLSDLPEDDLRKDLMHLATKGDASTGGLPLLKYHNPLARHVVLRRRADLEKAGLMDKIDVRLWPDGGGDQILFDGTAVRTPLEFQAAYEEIQKAIKIMRTRSKVVSFLGKLIMQRICSSVEAGMSTIERMIRGPDAVADADYDDDDDRDEAEKLAKALENRGDEIYHLQRALIQLRKVKEAGDPKLRSVRFFLEDSGWDRYGSIIFSQYYDTARWVGSKVSGLFMGDPVAVYAGSGKSGVFMGGRWTSADREDLKKMVENREIHLVCATDAACEGLNLQAIGTLINMDLPWNPSRLQQRIGRIKRFGQKRKSVDMASLVYQGTVDQEIYARLSQRMRDNFEILGSLPDTIEDDWIRDEEKARQALEDMTVPKSPADMFRLRYGGFLKEADDDWDTFEKVISADEMGNLMRTPWGKSGSKTKEKTT